jgi:hypothetical protein
LPAEGASLGRSAARRGTPLFWATLIAAGCTQVSGDAGHVAALQFDRLPYPSIVAGDSLRDSLGTPARLRAIAMNGSGAEIADAEVQYIALDTGVTIGTGGFITAQRRSGTVRLIASAGDIQTITSPGTTLTVTRRPDSVFVSGAARDTVDYDPIGSVTVNTSADLSTKIITRDTSDGVAVTQGWLVSYQAFFRGTAIAPGDTSVVFLLGDGNQRSGLDTTAATGIASRRIRVRPIGITQSATDSVVVIATVRHRGAAVRGSPLRFVILLRPKQ